jgi:putative beta-lysine N-acetyltransferase
MIDQIETWHHSLVQHGRLSNRIYLMKLAPHDTPHILKTLDQKAHEHGYTKIFAKIPSDQKGVFEENGYREAASVPQFYNGSTPASFMEKFLSEDRQKESHPKELRQILDKATGASNPPQKPRIPPGLVMSECDLSDVHQMGQLFQQVFKSYPFPIFDPDYLRATMKSHIRYFCVKKEDQMVALASAELDESEKNVEMTDFAILPPYRRQGLGFQLLRTMEKEVKKMGILTSYTIARALSIGANMTFGRAVYTYVGTLTNNTHFDGKIESMNVWYKTLNWVVN